jgi:hypothetical protein
MARTRPPKEMAVPAAAFEPSGMELEVALLDALLDGSASGVTADNGGDDGAAACWAGDNGSSSGDDGADENGGGGERGS